jgi:hypothetical protein
MPEEEDGGEDGAGESVRFLYIYIEREMMMMMMVT